VKLTVESETIGRTGGITGSGAKKVLGAPHIDSLEVVIREAVQNSWDAAERESIDFGVVGYEFEGSRKAALREAVSAGMSRKAPLIALPEGPLDALLLWDKGTTGLGGGLRPDETVDGKRDFVRFVYMIGDAKAQTDAFAKGGTYGFGRSSFLNASRLGTILLHTVCEYGGAKQSRFIGMTWTDPDRLEGTRFTGRHWWGKPDGRHVVPILGNDANRLATSLGFNVFSGDELGTAILVLLPRWSSDDEDVSAARARALSQIRAGLLWNCWPRLLDETINVSINWFGEGVDVPDPRNEVRLRIFTRAFDVASTSGLQAGSIRRTLECMRPMKTLGTLALTKAAYFAEGTSGDSDADDDHGERDGRHPLRHVAMMRGTRLVIHYLEGPMPPEGLQYAGVFLADEGVDAIYAASEPPAHDEWVKQRLAGQNRTLVNVTYKRVQDTIREFLQPSGYDAPDPAGVGDFGLLADQLGNLFVGVEGDGSGEDGSKGGGTGGEGGKGGGRKRVTVNLLPAQLLVRGEMLERRIPLRLLSKGRQSASVTLSASAIVVVEGGTEKHRAEGAALPEVLGWQLAQDAAVVEGSSIRVDVRGERECILTILQPRDCSVKVVVEAQ
jgi:hypothetical protein